MATKTNQTVRRFKSNIEDETTTSTLTSIMDWKNNLYLEDFFKKMIIRERKRSERSEEPFLILFLNIKKLIRKNNYADIVKNISAILDHTTRNEDIKGWYKSNHTIGIIFTEADKDEREKFIEKIKIMLTQSLDAKQVELIKITGLFFPEVRDKDEAARLYSNSFLGTLDEKIEKEVCYFIKRSLDIIGSLIAIFIFSPFFIILPILIKFSSSGPVFFKQKRVGKYGQTFPLFKFRSMINDNNCDVHKDFVKNLINGKISNSISKIQNDTRITKIGNFLRKSSLDELPQFFNILFGHMSLVGPRPAIQYEVEEYNAWHKRRVLEMKPGLTGFWQVEGRSRTTFDNMVRMDINYIENWSILGDLFLILKTPWVLLTAKGAY